MNTLWKTAGGLSLVALLLLTAVPAQALEDTPRNGDASAVADGSGEDDSSAGASAADNGDSASGAAGDGAGESSMESPAGADGDGGRGSTDAEAPDAVEQGSETHGTAVGPSAEELTQIPTSVPVSGTLLFAPDEPAMGTLDGAPVAAPEADADPEHAAHTSEGGAWSLATASGAILPIDPQAIQGDLEPLGTFVGELRIDAETRATAEQKIAAEGVISMEALVEEAGETAAAAESASDVTGTVAAAPAPLSAQAARSHTTDIAYFPTPNRSVSLADLQSLVTRSGSYWSGQTNGAVPGIAAGTPKTIDLGGTDACNQNALWTRAAKAFGKTPEAYYSGARHLVVFVDRPQSCGYAGLAHVGSLHSGGTVWANLGERRDRSVSGMLAVVAHEFGHNLGLGHGQVRQCSGSTVDTRTEGRIDGQTGLTVQRPVSPCSDVEYGDTWNIMGVSYWGMTPSLSVAQQDALGVAAGGSLVNVRAAGGRSQTVTVNAVSAASGVRGVTVQTQNGGSMYIEYRNGRDQDAVPGGISDSSYYNGATSSVRFGTGVQVVKSYPTAVWQGRPFAYKRSTVIPFRSGNTQYAAGKAQSSMAAWNSNAKITVLSTNASSAQVRVDFSPFIDVPYDHKFGTEINWMSSAGLSNGIAAGSLRAYDAKANVTREAMAAFLYRLNTPKGASGPSGYSVPKKSPFVDVPTNHKFYKEIAWMSTSGLSTGIRTPGGRAYDPKAGVTREAMAAFIYRMERASYPGAQTSQFSDVGKGDKFYKEISWMYQAGLSTGVKQPSGKPQYQPKNSVSREAMAAFIYRLKH